MIDVSPYQLEIIKKTLKKYVPECEVRVFGSRVTWTAKDYSDLDLVVVGAEKLSDDIVFSLKEAFQESDLPFRVDVLDWNSISDEFKAVINKGYEVFQERKTGFKETEIPACRAENGAGRGKIPEGWEEKELSSLGKIVTGKTPPTVNEDNFGNEYPFITPRDMKDQKQVKTTERYLSEKGKNAVKNCLVAGSTICVSCIGSDMGKVVMTTQPSVTNQQLNSIVPKKVNPDFVYYAVEGITDQMRDAAFHSTAVPILNKSSFAKFKILIPKDKKEADKIAKILSDLDSKIELNCQMNKTLEAIGQALFKRWFVDFEFPCLPSGYALGAGKPEDLDKVCTYKAVGGLPAPECKLRQAGDMVDSELGEIPKGWNVREIKSCGKVICGKTPPTKNKDNYGDGIFFITIPDMRGRVFVVKTERKISNHGAETQKKKELPALSICVSCIATPGLVSLTSDVSHTNQQINSIVCNESISPYYMYYLMVNKSEQIKAMGLGGTATLNLNTGNFSKIKVIIPTEKQMKEFHGSVKPVFERIVWNEKENMTLCKVRDSLLPRLMSGRIRVNA